MQLIASQPEVADETLDGLKPNVSGEEMQAIFHTYCEHDETERALAFYFDCPDQHASYRADHVAHFASLASAAGYRQEAIHILENLLKTEPTHAKALLELGWAHYLEDEYQQAESALRKAIQNAPESAHGYCSLAWVLSADELSKSQAEDGLRLATKMQDLGGYPEDRKLKVLARCQLRLGQTDAARSTIRRALRVASDDQIPVLRQMMPKA